jgi:NAD(P)-dependent dehydrogenase (short-subunit alcohol dehydrogenase family)
VVTKTAIVTGGASGIGRAIAAELVARGADVVIADVNAEAARLAAKQLTETLPGTATAAELDVRDAGAVRATYRETADRHGRLDLVFNNAGIAVGGLAEEFTLEHWDRTIDVNLRGVVHGVQAAYPIMLEQGGGHIVNTASLAGLVLPAIMGPYTATKYAVVGLSMALRAEGASRGVRVSALCPGFIDTPLLDNVNAGLPQTKVNSDTRSFIRRIQPRMYTAERLAGDVMRGIATNKALIIAPRSARVVAFIARHVPALALAANRWQVRRYLDTPR